MDITERKKDQEEKEKLQTLLNQAQRLESIGQLASGIAHDFNDILMPIMGFARLALVFCRNNEPERAIVCLEKVQVSSQRAAELVDKMLIFAREKTIKAESPILPSVVVEEVVKIGGMLRSGISATIDISFNNALTDASPLILIDPSELHQIMTNLMVNARDAIEEAQLDRPGDGKIEVQFRYRFIQGIRRRILQCLFA
jgi:C4-dicarboxylate-specific signal transduction histidine kinase